MILSDFTLHSGGANGADTEWDIQGQPYGVTAKHYYAEGQPTPRGNIALSPRELAHADPWLKRVNAEFLHRTFPTRNDWTNNLLRRNYYQVIGVEAIFAISIFVNRVVVGGTAWAVYMGILMQKPVYVFDQVEEQWFRWGSNGGAFHTWQLIDTPKLTTSFAGIGTHEINAAGIKAIAEVYKQTALTITDLKSITQKTFTVSGGVADYIHNLVKNNDK